MPLLSAKRSGFVVCALVEKQFENVGSRLEEGDTEF
jgi:hypothetical protein